MTGVNDQSEAAKRASGKADWWSNLDSMSDALKGSETCDASLQALSGLQ